MIMTLLEKLVVPIIGVILTVVLTVYLNNKNQLKIQTNYILSAINAAKQIGFLCLKLKHLTKTKRVVLLKIENGNILDDSSQKFVSIIEEVNDSTIIPSFNLFQKYPLDDEYKKIMKKLLNKESIFLDTLNMTDGFLKRFYIVANIKKSFIFPVYFTQNKLVYASISSDEDFEVNSEILSHIDAFVHRIGQKLQRYPELMDSLTFI